MTYLINFICVTYLFWGVTDCVLNLCPHHKSFSSNCFKTVVGMFSWRSSLWCFRHPSLPPDTVFHQTPKRLSWMFTGFFLRFARQQESRLFFLHQGFLLSRTLYQLNKTMIRGKTLWPSRYASTMITKKTKINGGMSRATWCPEWRSVTILHWSRSLPYVVLFFKNAYYRIFCKKKRIMVYRRLSG